MTTNITTEQGWTDLNVHNHPALNIYGTRANGNPRRDSLRWKLDAERDEGFLKALVEANRLKNAGTPADIRKFTLACWKLCVLQPFLDDTGQPPNQYEGDNENVKRAIDFFEFGRYGKHNKQLYTDREMELGTDNKVAGLEFWNFPEPVVFLLLVKPVLNGAARYLKACNKLLRARREAGDAKVPSDPELDRLMTVDKQFGFTGETTIIIPTTPKITALDKALREGFDFGLGLSQASNPTTSS